MWTKVVELMNAGVLSTSGSQAKIDMRSCSATFPTSHLQPGKNPTKNLLDFLVSSLGLTC